MLIFGIAYLALSTLPPSDDSHTPNLRDYQKTVAAIIDEALTRPVGYRNLKELCAQAPRRLSGSPGYAAAVEWTRQAMVRAGCDNVRLQPVMVPHWERGTVGLLRIVEPAEAAGESLPILALGGSIATPDAGLTAEIIEVQNFEELHERRAEAKGRIVLFNRPMDPRLRDPFQAYGGAVNQRTRGAVEAAKAGALAAIVRSLTPGIDDVPHTGAMRYSDGVPRIPTAAVSTRGAERLAALLRTHKRVAVHFRQDCRTHEDSPAHNVIGEWTGSVHPEQVVVVAGHLDAWDVGHGAHDDGSGVCQSIEALRILKALGLRPKRTLRAIAFANEENGLRGGHAYHEEHLSEMREHVLAIESDRGGFTPRGFTTNANPAALAILRGIGALLEDVGAAMVREGGGGADISPMEKSGVVLMGYLPDGQRYFDLHHTHEDTIEKVSERELQLGAAVIAAMAYVVADLAEPLPRNPVRE